MLRALQQRARAEVSWAAPGGGEHLVRPRGRVGWFPTSEGVAVRIVPKVPVAQILAMLEVAFDLPSLRFGTGLVEAPEVEGILERLALLLAEGITERVRRGLIKGYVAETEAVEVIRGRLDLTASLPAIAHGRGRVVCEFDEHSHDMDDNRLLLWALHHALTAPLRPAVKEKVARAHRALAGSVSLAPSNGAAYSGRSYHRLNADYEPLHRIGRLVVECSAPELGAGPSRFLPFSLDFPSLFEVFVARSLASGLDRRWRVRPHVRRSVGAPAAFEVDVDIVIAERRTGQPVLVVDTKHKTGLDSRDVYQAAFYAHEVGARRAVLLYSHEAPPPLRLFNGGVEVCTRGLDLSRDPVGSVARFARELAAELERSST